jgi:hypothetical protein
MAENGAEIARTWAEGRITPGVAWHGSRPALGAVRVQDGVVDTYTGKCTCGGEAPEPPYGHEPVCGWELLGYLASNPDPCGGAPQDCQAPGQCHACGTATEIETRQLDEWGRTLTEAIDSWENNGDADGFFEDGYLDHTHLSRARDMLAQIDSVITRARRQGGRG